MRWRPLVISIKYKNSDAMKVIPIVAVRNPPRPVTIFASQAMIKFVIANDMNRMWMRRIEFVCKGLMFCIRKRKIAELHDCITIFFLDEFEKISQTRVSVFCQTTVQICDDSQLNRLGKIQRFIGERNGGKRAKGTGHDGGFDDITSKNPWFIFAHHFTFSVQKPLTPLPNTTILQSSETTQQ